MMMRAALMLLLLMPATAWAASWMTPQQAAGWLKATPHVHIVDIRNKKTYMAGTLKGAVNLTLKQLRSMNPEGTAWLLLIADEVDEQELPQGYAGIKLLKYDLGEWKKQGLHAVRVTLVPSFVIPRGLCEMNEPADEHDAETVEEDL